jgi:hypothetical protein
MDVMWDVFLTVSETGTLDLEVTDLLMHEKPLNGSSNKWLSVGRSSMYPVDLLNSIIRKACAAFRCRRNLSENA